VTDNVRAAEQLAKLEELERRAWEFIEPHFASTGQACRPPNPLRRGCCANSGSHLLLDVGCLARPKLIPVGNRRPSLHGSGSDPERLGR
jgi:hypothetical protein